MASITAMCVAAGITTLGVVKCLQYIKRRKTSKLPQRFCIVITGSSQGLGLALARGFLKLSKGNVRVVLNSRDGSNLDRAVKQLRKEFSHLVEQDTCCISGFRGDVRNADDMERLAQFAATAMGTITHWVNNAGITQTARASLVDTPADELRSVVETNLLGVLFGTRAALRTMPSGAHIFNIEGNGSRQNATPLSIAYGVSKAGLRQLNKSLVSETSESGIGCHLISPGMIMTRLLVRYATDARTRFVFEVLADPADTVGAELAPKVMATQGTGTRIDYLTPWRVAGRFALCWTYRGRFFASDGTCKLHIE